MAVADIASNERQPLLPVSIQGASNWTPSGDQSPCVIAPSPGRLTISEDKYRLLQSPLQTAHHAGLKQDPHAESTFAEAVFNAVNVLLGVGVLSMAFALRSSGWLVGVPLFAFFALVTNYTAKLLGKCLQFQPGMKTYQDIGEAAFGTPGRVLVCVVFFNELFTACCMFDILIGDTLAALIPSYSSTQLMLVAFALLLPSLWTSHLSPLSYLSLLGVVSSLVTLGAVLGIGWTLDPSSPDYSIGSLQQPQETEWLASADRIPLSIGLTMVAFGGHSVFPAICSSMQDRAQFPRVLNVTYVLVVVVYGIIEVAGYLMFGTSTSKEITLNLLAVSPGGLTRVVLWMVAINPMSKIAISVHPIALAFEEWILPRVGISEHRRRLRYRATIVRAIVRSSIGIAALLCALFVPQFARVTSFFGAFFAILASIVLPCSCYLKLYGARISRREWIGTSVLAVIAVVLAIVGTIATFISPAE